MNKKTLRNDLKSKLILQITNNESFYGLFDTILVVWMQLKYILLKEIS